MQASNSSSPRLASLDMLRGTAIAGMVLVNNPGSWAHMYPFLRHAGWTGCSPADLVFPFFLFAVGAALSFSLAGHAHTGTLPVSLLIKMLRRTVLLFSLGVFLNALPGLLQAALHMSEFDPGRLRIMGVLQRIAIVYLWAGICIVFLSKRMLWTVTILLLAGYSAVLALFPGPLSPESNPALIIDRLVLGAPHLYNGGLDPEGLFSTVSSLVTALLGYGAGCCLRQAGGRCSGSVKLFIAGLFGLAFGYLWGLWMPVSKDLWTGPYVLITAGWAAFIFTLCQETAKASALRRCLLPLQVMGRHSLIFFVASGIAVRILLAVTITSGERTLHLWNWLYEDLFAPWMGRTELSSFIFAAAWLVLWAMTLHLLDRKARQVKL